MPLCKICFKEIKPNDLHSFCCKKQIICADCMSKLKPSFRSFSINNIKGLAIYDYDENIEGLLYQFKGCFDIELKDVFLARFSKELRLYFRGYSIVPIPSYISDDMKREFNHVIEMFSCLDLPIIRVLEKTMKYKQSDQKRKDRKLIAKVLKMSNINEIENKKILLVDDVCTTGSSLSAAINLIRLGKPKMIKILVMSKVLYKKDLIHANAKSIGDI